MLVFAVAQALRDAYFGNVFQTTSFLVVAVLSFGAMTLIFGGISVITKPDQLRLLWVHRRAFIWLNVTTALAWMGFFFALAHAEPAVVTTLYTGIGPLAAVVLSSKGWWSHERTRTSTAERAGYLGVALALVATGAVSILGFSGLTEQPLHLRVAAVGAAAAGGVVIVISHGIARQLNDVGAGSDTLTGGRFMLALGLAACLELGFGDASMRPTADRLPLLAAAAFLLIALPSFSLQLGIARTSPLAVNVVRALGPVFVFAIQQLDGRLAFSGATLACVALFVVSALWVFALRSRAEMAASGSKAARV